MARAVRLLISVLGVLLVGACAAAGTGGTSEVVSQLPFEDGETYVYELENIEGELIGYGRFLTRRQGEALLLEQAFRRESFEEPGEPVDRVSLVVSASTLRPIEGTRVITATTANGEQGTERYEWSYAGGGEGPLLVRTHSGPGDEAERGELDLREHYYDNESSLWLWRTLAFAEDYDERYVSVNPMELSQTTVNVTIPLRQTVEVPAGTFDTWRLILRTGRAVRTAWINAAPPHQVVQFDNGEMMFRLGTSGTSP